MQKLFAPHPYSTPVGILIERATDGGQLSENWSLILEICDSVNETDDGPKEAARAIRKRFISSSGKDPLSVWYTLLLLEACLRNCGRRFYNQVANKDFLHDFLKLLSPKNEPSQDLQDMVLFMLKSWVDAGWDVPGRRELEKIYNALRQKGIQFPSSAPIGFYKRTSTKTTIQSQTRSPKHRNGYVSMDDFVPESHAQLVGVRHVFPQMGSAVIAQVPPCSSCGLCHKRPSAHNHGFGEHRVVRRPCSCRNRHLNEMVYSSLPDTGFAHSDTARLVEDQAGKRQPAIDRHASDQTEFDADGTVRRLSSAQRIKLTQDLSVIEVNVNVLNDMLAELRPDSVDADDLSLLQELYETCQAMHSRVVEFLGQVSDEEVTPSLLQVNDNLNSAFSRYDRFERYRLHHLQSKESNCLAIDSLPQGTPSDRTRKITGQSALFAITSGEQDEPVLLSGLPNNDDEPLIDVSGENGEITPRNLIDTDELASWVMSRRMAVPSSLTPASHQPSTAPAALQYVTQSIESLALVPTTSALCPSTSHAQPAQPNKPSSSSLVFNHTARNSANSCGPKPSDSADLLHL